LRVASREGCTQKSLFDAHGPLKNVARPTLVAGDFVSSLADLVAQGRRFPTIYADPPWPYDNEASRAAAVNHYPTLALSDIRREPVSDLAEADSHLHLWTTNAFLQEAFEVIEGYITVGFYDDGRPGEVFIKVAKHGSTISGLLDTIAVLTSLALQYGVPVDVLARKFEFTRFEPAGWTKNPELRHVQSLVDYVFRWLGLQCSPEYLSEKLERRDDKSEQRSRESH
jgi:hypothetical protein